MWCRGTPGRNEVPSANVESTQFAKKKIVLIFISVAQQNPYLLQARRKELRSNTSVSLTPKSRPKQRAVSRVHTFVDATEQAYAAPVYWRVIDGEGRAHITLPPTYYQRYYHQATNR
ncbi:hypothetical protein EVAR_84413_1 [Eumeta japonica]|uniref:Uncharacterized protein n=1 Tax=Eumeta variegata TaxID=151549 RepID=A0A4C1W2Z4_EUMVA|nr:hypothetical protein EVAR_84413_1 [Eumeta japonica]